MRDEIKASLKDIYSQVCELRKIVEQQDPPYTAGGRPIDPNLMELEMILENIGADR